MFLYFYIITRINNFYNRLKLFYSYYKDDALNREIEFFQILNTHLNNYLI
jgi:hypothetical protein